ncbi:MAG TPA: ABC transporter ATP-binding protein [Clostridiaceae bacterium]|nr:ABC transporter ATP-binding protein [Clostridiaceae bacterium]
MIELINVKKYYGLSRTGLEKESVTFNDGEITGIIGENGSGKTTMLKAIMGLCELTEGRILIDGLPVTSVYGKMSFITEEGSYFPGMTPLEYGDFLKSFFAGFDMDRFLKLLEYFEIEKNSKIRNMSRGQKSKVEIAAGFSKGAKYILMDEPFLGNDMFTRHDFLKLMISSLRGEETILISTHLINEIENFVDRIVILQMGRIKADFYMDDMKETGKSLKEVLMETTGYDEEWYKKLFDT